MDIKIVEVSPRDGLQNEKTQVPLDVKLELINKLINTGVSTIEVTSFVSPKWVPQMADHEALVKALPEVDDDIRFPVLVPNMQGLENAQKLGVRDIAVFAAASETFSQKNINCSIEESLMRVSAVIETAKEQGINVRGYVSCVLGCPYEGAVHLARVVHVAKALYDAGCYEISLGDTIGVGTPANAVNMLKTVEQEVPLSKLALHFHDTYGQALANIYACLEVGATIIDSSVAGIGGCPYAKGATGNVATEDVLYMLEGLNLRTGIDLMSMIEAGKYISDYLQRPNHSKVARAILSRAN